MASKKYNQQELQEIREEWDNIPYDVIPVDQRDAFIRRKSAVDMYIDGKGVKDIEEETGITHNNLPRFIARCLKTDVRGEYYGYRALLLNSKIMTDDASMGKFAKLLSDYPELPEFIEGCWYRDKAYTLTHNMNVATLHRRFIEKCKELKVPDYGYPFNTANQGYVSLCKYVKELDKKDIRKASTRQGKDDRQKLLSTGYGTRYSSVPIAPYSVVQLDGHIIDLLYKVQVVDDDGTITSKIATRAWVIAVIDSATRCILGYSVSQEYNYNQHDVIEAFQNAILPKEKPTVTIDGFHYPDNGGFPSIAFPELEYALFDTVMLDNAKSHLAINTMDKLVDHLHCAVDFGSVATPETRGIVERFFQTLEERGFHQLPATTGSNSKDVRRQNAEKEVQKYNITFELIVQLLDALIAEYNNRPHSSLQNLSPLECLRRRVFDQGMFPTIADEEMIETVEKLNYIVETRVVRGGKNGKRAYINYEGAEYRSNALSATGQYLGQTITLYINPRDISTVEAYAENGVYIGVLKARGEYGNKPHSLKTRKNARRLARERGREHMEFDTPITALERQLNKEGKKKRREATKADIVRREQGKPKPSEVAESKKKNPTPIVPIDTNSVFIPNTNDPDKFIEETWGYK